MPLISPMSPLNPSHQTNICMYQGNFNETIRFHWSKADLLSMPNTAYLLNPWAKFVIVFRFSQFLVALRGKGERRRASARESFPLGAVQGRQVEATALLAMWWLIELILPYTRTEQQNYITTAVTPAVTSNKLVLVGIYGCGSARLVL